MDRKRLMRWMTALFLVAGLFFVGKTCQTEHAEVTFVFERGDGPAVTALSATLLRADEVVASFERSPGPEAAGELARWTLDLDPGSYRLELEIVTAAGRSRTVKTIEAVPRATIRLDLGKL